MTDYKKTGRDRGDGATRKSLLQQIHADFPGNSTDAQRARLLAAMREAGHITTTEARLFLETILERLPNLRFDGPMKKDHRIPIFNGIGVVGGMLPAVGIALNLRAILKKETWPFLIIGFLLVAYFKISIIGVALFGVAAAMIYMLMNTKKEGAATHE